mmetsp:Transcript_88544/g.236635  ORF Transcript_88544/g.236635 Transcript_88544/m.236635 type:complete len:1132 (-) Transcript_88544:8-3403(-)
MPRGRMWPFFAGQTDYFEGMSLFLPVTREYSAFVMKFSEVLVVPSEVTAALGGASQEMDSYLVVQCAAAIELGHTSVAVHAIQQGVNVDGGDPITGEPFLVMAARMFDAEVCRVLLAGSVDANATDDRSGMTALHMAIEHADCQLTQELIDGGASVLLMDHAELSPCDVAAQVCADPTNDEEKRDASSLLHLLAQAALVELKRSSAQTRALSKQAASTVGDITQRSMKGDVSSTVHALVAAGAAEHIGDGEPLLVAVARAGLTSVVHEIIRRSWNVDIVSPIDGTTPVIAATQGGHLDLVTVLVQAGASLALPNFKKQTALDIASSLGLFAMRTAILRMDLQGCAASGHEDLVQQSLQASCSPNAVHPKTGATPLCAAAAAGHVGVCHLLLRHKAEPDCVKGTGVTPLYAAANSGRVGVVDLLLHAKAHVNFRCGKRTFPVFGAVTSDSHSVAGLSVLVDSRAELSEEDDARTTPLLQAVKLQRPAMQEVLLRANASPNQRLRDGFTLVHRASEWAADEGVQSVRRLLELKADPNACANGRAPLHVAAHFADADVVHELLSRKAHVNAVDDHNRTALIVALEAGNESVAQHLLNCIAIEVNAIAKRPLGQAALHIALRKQLSLIVEMLLDNTADPNLVEVASSHAPILIAAEHSGPECIHLLVRAGADLAVRDSLQRAPVEVAADLGREELVALLRAMDVHQAVRYGDVTGIRMALQYGVSPNCFELDTGFTPLLIGVLQGMAEVVDILLDADADVNTPSVGGLLPLHCALMQGDGETVALLIECSAEMGVLQGNGDTPLLTALGHHATPDIIKNLLSALASASTECQFIAEDRAPETGFAVGDTVEFKAGSATSTAWGTVVELGEHNMVSVAFGKPRRPCRSHQLRFARVHGEVTTPLLTAIERRCSDEVVRMLCLAGASPSQEFGGGQPVHHVILRGGSDEEAARVVARLLDLGACANVCESAPSSRTPLHIAALANRYSLVCELLHLQADVNGKDGAGNTPLLSALLHWTALVPETVRALLEAAADVHARDHGGRTALHWAARHGDISVASALVAAKADSRSLALDGQSVMQEALTATSGRAEREVDSALTRMWNLLLGNGTESMIAPSPPSEPRTPVAQPPSVPDIS